MDDRTQARLAAALEGAPPEDPRWVELARGGLRAGAWPAPPGAQGALLAALEARAREEEARAPLAAWALAGWGLEPDPVLRDLEPDRGLPRVARRVRDGGRVRLLPGAGPVAYLDEVPVSVADYAGFLEATRRRPPDEWRELKRYRDRPVVLVTWEDAAAYAAWVGGELPGRSCWERAAGRGPGGTPYPWGQVPPDPDLAVFARPFTAGVTWHEGLPVLGTRPEGAGPGGHRDLAGMVWEWCLEVDRDEDERDEDELEEEAPRRLALGGSWRSEARDLRAGVACWLLPTARLDDVGFRVRCGAPPPG